MSKRKRGSGKLFLATFTTNKPKHATVVRDGYTVPLIGIPPEAVLQACDCCGDEVPLSQTVFTGSQTLCPKCNKPSVTP